MCKKECQMISDKMDVNKTYLFLITYILPKTSGYITKKFGKETLAS